METTVKLLSWTADPEATIYCEWLQSRSTDPVPTAAEVAARVAQIRHEMTEEEREQEDITFEREVRETFDKVLKMKFPLAETLDFVFLLEHMPIALREQIVRHRVGHRFSDTLGADLIPLDQPSSFWSQSFRVMDFSRFASEGDFYTPDSIKGNTKPMPGQEKYDNPKSVEKFYREQMLWCQQAYKKLVDAGVPLEDARGILPLHLQHRMTWKINLAALLHVLGKRTCWIAQLGMWEPVVRGMIHELVTKVHPAFAGLLDPPCFKDGQWNGCAYKKENEDFVSGKTKFAPCPLYLGKHAAEAIAASTENHESWQHSVHHGGWVAPTAEMMTQLTVRGNRYRDLWRRDEHTGEKLGDTGELFSQKAGG